MGAVTKVTTTIKLEESGRMIEWISGSCADYNGYVLFCKMSDQQAVYKFMLCTHRECKLTDEGGRIVLHSLRVHSCTSMLNNICSRAQLVGHYSLYYIISCQAHVPFPVCPQTNFQ